MSKLKLPIGVESFEEIVTKGWYYVDKTIMIKDVVDLGGKVNLFTRPRRFGKSLNMDMLKEFFEIGADSQLFEGLAISQETDFCQEYMGKYPVISISLKDVESETFQGACDMMSAAISEEVRRHKYLLNSDKLTQMDKEALYDMMRWNQEMSEQTICTSIRTLSMLLSQHYNQKVIILIDEYDVPLAKASLKQYYQEMISVIRRMFAQGLKTNPYLEFAVLTGCLRVSRESVFTGLNNLKVFTITDDQFSSYFGFTDQEVREMLTYYDAQDYYDITREWYDGYRFGNSYIYCPWDVINWCYLLYTSSRRQPQNYWANSSGNDALKHLIYTADDEVPKEDLAELTRGGTIYKKISQELTYGELYDTMDNVWSILYTTGYLTLAGEPDGNIFPLRIPNREVMEIFEEQLMQLFMDHVRADKERLYALCGVLKSGNASGFEQMFGDYLTDLISIRDTAVRKDKKENFYHGVLLGILGMQNQWYVKSNLESGNGYADILIHTNKDGNVGIVIEVEYAENGDFATACRRGMTQIEETGYSEALKERKAEKIYKFVIACYKKECKVEVKEQAYQAK